MVTNRTFIGGLAFRFHGALPGAYLVDIIAHQKVVNCMCAFANAFIRRYNSAFAYTESGLEGEELIVVREAEVSRPSAAADFIGRPPVILPRFTDDNTCMVVSSQGTEKSVNVFRLDVLQRAGGENDNGTTIETCNNLVNLFGSANDEIQIVGSVHAVGAINDCRIDIKADKRDFFELSRKIAKLSSRRAAGLEYHQTLRRILAHPLNASESRVGLFESKVPDLPAEVDLLTVIVLRPGCSGISAHADAFHSFSFFRAGLLNVNLFRPVVKGIGQDQVLEAVPLFRRFPFRQ